jgi:hypothetical protein
MAKRFDLYRVHGYDQYDSYAEISPANTKLSITICINEVFPNLLGRLCGPVVRVPGYGSRDLGFDSQSYQIF